MRFLDYVESLADHLTQNIIGKSVASVSSPVQNLEHWSANIDHDSFVEAATERFARQYESSSDVEVWENTLFQTDRLCID